MAKYLIEGGKPLNGVIRVSGSKNASLPILAASLLYPGKSVIHEVPVLSDIEVMFEVLGCLGAKVQRSGSTVQVDAAHLTGWEIKEDLTRKIRASNLVLGALLGRLGKAWISLPGGCNIGSRPMDLHLKGLL
ncbi:MAG: UDP-N-acetylglucosamine 1-carboxyvinyltransferase, partial [Clostridia bacterium]|nr:UDP-N-acetylglucosamine 1-carboxyvinyltransferase [Clostridia bacterium]